MSSQHILITPILKKKHQTRKKTMHIVTQLIGENSNMKKHSEPEFAGDFLILFSWNSIHIQLPRPGLPSLAIEFEYYLFQIAKTWNTKSWN